jgi:demethylspheroidene O-methyltransferase
LPAPYTIDWSDRWHAFRDRLLSSDGFRRWALSFPLTRPIARRRTRALFDLCAGFVYSQILFACVQLRLFDILAEGPRTGAELAHGLALSPDAAARLLTAAASLDLIEPRRGGRFGLGPLGAAMVGNEAVAAMVRHHAILYADISDPVALLRGEPAEPALARYWAYARSSRPDCLTAGQIAGYTDLMAASQAMIAADILDAYPVRRHRHLLDIGGGDATFLMAAGTRAPKLQLTLFDLPPVAERARMRVAASAGADRFDAVGGDFRAGPLPRGADLISLVRVLHDHDDQAALDLLRAIRQVLPSDGRLLVAEPMAGTRGAKPVGDAYFGFYLTAMRSGRPRRAEDIQAMLRAAGFAHSRLIPTKSPLVVRAILAHP